MRIKEKFLYGTSLMLLVFTINACRVKRFIPENEKLYGGATIKIINSNHVKKISGIEAELNELLRPEPNSKFLGSRVGLFYHYKAQKEEKGFITKYLDKKIGEEPVYFSDISQSRVLDLIKNRLDNRGFFNSKVTSSVQEKKLSKSVIYTVELAEPYTLETYQLENDSLPIYKEIQKNLEKTLLKKGTRYSLEAFKQERIELDDKIKAKGYYNFNQDFLIFEADTNQYQKKKFDLYLRLKKETPKKATIPYKIDRVTVHPNYNLASQKSTQDTLKYKDVYFLQDTVFFKKERLRNYLLLKENDFYNPYNSKITSKRLSSIGTYKYVNIQFEEYKNVDSVGHLNADIYLSPLNKRALGIELQAVTKSNNFSGPGLSVNYRNRNLFKGGELLTIMATAAYETQVGNNSEDLNGTQLGLNTSLVFPRLIFPGNYNGRFKYGIPKTKVALDIEYLDRSNLYNLTSFTSSFGYTWDANKYLSYQLNPININYVKLSNTTAEFEEILENNTFLQSSFDQQFIAGLTFNFTYNELGRSSKKNQVYFSSNLDVAGNVLSLMSSKSAGGEKEFLGLEYAQYAKIDADFRHYIDLGKEQQLISRLYGGIGIPYGNSEVLPYTKQFFSGGPYSVRGFSSRSIGPGAYAGTSSDNSFFDRSGDIRLEANLEYRFPVYSVLKGALFTDAGNVWLYGQNGVDGEGQFSSKFLNEMAVSVGVGLRVDIQSFVIRLDYATPIKLPTSPTIEKIQLKESVLNFAIGYPF
ncbi:BamA/TamA family outer membrane protein [Wenyingzhuangia sp. 1_MG-2023]|nr:BamA/TamA family outer membrane protein [Wenyingzhuangia sp. 1_MG-2023]